MEIRIRTEEGILKAVLKNKHAQTLYLWKNDIVAISEGA
jgi:hypothetical protein